jgi:hypothetical protein
VIALQESPYPSWGSDTFRDYTSVGVQPSHCGYVDLLLRKGLHYEPMELENLPSVAARLTFPEKVVVSSSHLAPFKDGFPLRRQQLHDLMSTMTRGCDNCIILGDLNMRAAEDEYVENMCGGWSDAWKGCGSDLSSKFTWDSFVKLSSLIGYLTHVQLEFLTRCLLLSRYHKDGFKFKARFDRCYTQGESLKLKHFSLIGNRPVEEDNRRGDYLSDHFGILVRLDVDGFTSNNEYL